MNEKEYVLKCYTDGMSRREISRLTGVPRTTVNEWTNDSDKGVSNGQKD